MSAAAIFDDTMPEQREARVTTLATTALRVLLSAGCYYLATRIAWVLCFPDSKVSLFFPPHAVLVAVLLVVPIRHWWAYTLAAAAGHFFATQQAHWPPWYAMHCEVFDAVQNVGVAAGIRLFIKSPLRFVTLREAIVFVLVAVVIVPFGTAFWGAAFTISNGFGTRYWVEWRNLAISNAVTAIVLVPAFLEGLRHLATRKFETTPGRMLEAGLLGACVLTVGYLAFDRLPAGPDTSPALLYAPIPLLIWAALGFGVSGMCASMLVITFQAIWGTMHGRGPFLTQTPAENALELQLLLLFTATPLLFLAVVVEEQKSSQQALRESEERYREVVESQTDLVFRHLADSTLTFANDACCRSLGRSREDILGRRLLELMPLPARAAVASHIASLIQHQRTETREIEITLPNGSAAFYQWTAYPIVGAGGQVEEFQVIGHDVSDRKRAEEALRNLAHATRVSTMGALAGSLAHELNQPLTAILTNAQAGSRFLSNPAPDLAEVREVLLEVAADANRASSVIRQVRTMIKKEDLRFTDLELDRLIQDAVRLLHSDTVIRKVQVALDLRADPGVVRGDGVQLQQVMLNLMLNAFDAMKDVPEIERTVFVRTRLPGPQLIQVEVCDCGTGLRKERLERLFEPFQTTKREGLGLGLPISLAIVEAHGGRLWAENNPDRGTTFYFSVPLASIP